MRDEYDFSDAVKNPYAKHMKKAVTINLDVRVIDYFKELAKDTGIPYQTLINQYLLDCAENRKELHISWS